MTTLNTLIGEVWSSEALMSDFNDICDAGGRFAATPSEMKARELLKGKLKLALGNEPHVITYPFQGWQRGEASLELLGNQQHLLETTSLVFSPPTKDLEVELVDLGRGTHEDFQARAQEIKGKAVLVRHEFPFSVSHVHRRRKYGWAVDAGAVAFIIANNVLGGGVVTGSSGHGKEQDIPSLGIAHEGGERLAQECRHAPTWVRITIASQRIDVVGEHIVADIPGETDEWIIVCAHLDGHHLAESAMDNGSGLAVALEVARRMKDGGSTLKRGLRVIFFTFEEWALIGSQLYIQGLSQEEREKIALVINLDTVVGSPKLTALVSGHIEVANFIKAVTKQAGVPVQPILPLQPNSDHYNFYLAGVPSLRLIAGYEDSSSLTRFLLTPADTRDKVDPGQLRLAAMTTLSLVFEACSHSGVIARHLSPEQLNHQLDASDPWVADRT